MADLVLAVLHFALIFWSAYWGAEAGLVHEGMDGMQVPPTVGFFAWQRRKEPGFRPAAADVRSVRRLIVAQADVLLVIPLLAGLMARGL